MKKQISISQTTNENIFYYINQACDEAYELGYQCGKGQSDQDKENTEKMIEELVEKLRELKDVPSRETGGTWIEKNSHTYLCDKCGFEQDIWDNLREYKFCPRCGTNMEWLDRGYMPIELNET